ncbi:MAG: hypothetical protein R3232_09900 [Clostridia bacterium]|nr:hypothetical protein [Clostridia bacterium]
MIPIAKNITVVDENGKEYEPTYLKRARGLVKIGRARFVAEDKICLSRPPKENSEDKIMSDNINKKPEVNPTVENAMGATKDFLSDKQEGFNMSIEYIMGKINQILDDKKHIYDTIEALKGPISEGKAMALGTVVESREKTNRQILGMFEKVVDYHMVKPSNELELSKLQAFINGPK